MWKFILLQAVSTWTEVITSFTYRKELKLQDFGALLTSKYNEENYIYIYIVLI
jgi:hypothetical protein